MIKRQNIIIKNIFLLYQKEIESGMDLDIDTWLSRNYPEAESEYPMLKKMLAGVLLIQDYQDINTDEAWKKVYAKKASHKKYSYIRRLKYAASVSLAIIISLFTYYLTDINEKDNQVNTSIDAPPGKDQAILVLSSGEEISFDNIGKGMFTNREGNQIGLNISNTIIFNETIDMQHVSGVNTLIVPVGGIYRIILNDGSRIVLNSGSKLKFSDFFEPDERIVELDGEAYFEVTPDKTKPFVVNTNHSKVTVLGTSFNICSYNDDAFEQVTLVSGVVNVACNGYSYDIEKGIQFEWKKGVATNRQVNTTLYTSWKDDLFSFENMRLDEIMVKLARWYNIDFKFHDDNCSSLRFSGAMERTVNLNEFIKLIESTTDVKFKMDDKTIIISKKSKSN